MYKEKGLTWLGIAAVCCLLSACAGHLVCVPEEVVTIPEEPAPPPVVVQPETIRTPTEPQTSPGFIPNPSGDGKIAVNREGTPLVDKTSFAYDDSTLTASARAVLRDHARLLTQNRSQRVLIEGHCDERGTREYNLALGERRAMAVVDYFLANGVRSSQIDSRSFGEERPIDAASTEAAYAKNRRVEIKYY